MMHESIRKIREQDERLSRRFREIAVGFKLKEHIFHPYPHSSWDYKNRQRIFCCPFCSKRMNSESYKQFGTSEFEIAIMEHIGEYHPDWRRLENNIR